MTSQVKAAASGRGRHKPITRPGALDAPVAGMSKW
jgi:hypothetical protein